MTVREFLSQIDIDKDLDLEIRLIDCIGRRMDLGCLVPRRSKGDGVAFVSDAIKNCNC
jgi:hypothetical protein